jgi:methyl-accepting chemotaxis protein
MSNLKIGVRLALGFAFVLALTVVMGLFSINRIGVVNDATTDIATNWLVATRSLGDYRSVLSDMRRAEGVHVMANKPEQFDQAEKRISDDKEKAAKAIKAYADTVTPGEEQKLYADIQDAEKRYYATQPELIKMSRASDGVTDTLRDYYGGVSVKALNELLAAIDADIAFQTKGADEAYHLSQTTFASTRMAVIVLLLVSIALGAVLAWTITSSITKPVNEALRLVESVAEGDLTSKVHSDGKDEIGQLIRAMLDMNHSLVKVVTNVRRGSEGVATASSEIAHGNQDLSARTESQASSLEETAASMEELSATVKQNSDSARQANQLAMSASTIAMQGGQVVGRVVETMKGISESSRKISDIISVIDGIAFQTNILALNAAVEAARAGEQGRGFAVVASEVRSLAGRSADAAREIKSLINSSVERVELGTALVDQAGSTMSEVVSSIKRVADLMSEISGASSEQAAGVSQVGEAVQNMDQVTQQNAALVEEMAAAASSLHSQAKELVQVVAVFKLDGKSHSVAHSASSPVNVHLAPKRKLTAAKPKAVSAWPSTPKPVSLSKPAATAKSEMSGGTGEWETF